ncbi:hypothetical protein Ancab_028259 [Ancistrocladus abbreviatus]
MKGTGAKLILLHPSSLHKQSGGGAAAAGSTHRLWLLLLLSLFAFTFLLTLINNTKYSPSTSAADSSSAGAAITHLSKPIADALLHYAAASNSTYRMTAAEMETISTAIRNCSASSPCNFLIFGLTHETLLWKALNHGGRTVFLDENEYLISKYEQSLGADFEAYDVQYTTKVSNFPELINAVKDRLKNECRPVQNLLFSDCKLGINDLPNHLYVVPWDLILVDGPKGYSPKMPGRMSAIFTAAVLARSKRGGSGDDKTHVFVHDFDREVERVCSQEFLCSDNLVEVKGSLAHFVVEKMEADSFEFCTESKSKGKGRKVKSALSSSSSSSSSRRRIK